ncbi:MAG: hypothetical protein RJA81_2188, partial [Planctomycetota bacterium]
MRRWSLFFVLISVLSLNSAQAS